MSGIMAADFPLADVERLPIFAEEASSAAVLIEMARGGGPPEISSGGGSRVAVEGGVMSSGGGTSFHPTVCKITRDANCEETNEDAGRHGQPDFYESEGDNADAFDEVHCSISNPPTVDSVMADQATSEGAASAKSTGRIDPQAPGWTTRVRVGKQPPDRMPCPQRVCALEKTIRGYADKLGDHVIEPEIGLTFDSLGEAYDYYNLYSWELGFGIRYGKSRLNAEKTKCMQEVVCGCSGKPIKENSRSCRCECPAMIRLLRTHDNGWYITEHRVKHNHSLSTTCGEKVNWPSHKHIDVYTKDLVKQLRQNNIT